MSDKFDKTDAIKGSLIAGALIGIGYLIYRYFHRSAPRSHSPSPQPPPIDLTFAAKVRDDLVAKLKLQPNETGEQGKINRHQVFFIYRRAIALGKADAKLREGQGLETLKKRVELELGQVNKFLDDKLGDKMGASKRGPYFGGPNPLPIPHLDLGRYVSPRLIDPPSTTEIDAVNATSKSVS